MKMKSGIKHFLIGAIVCGGFYASQSGLLNFEKSPSLELSKDKVVQTIEQLHYDVSHEEESPEEVAAHWERQNQSSCREVSSAFNKWKESSQKEDLKQVIKLVGLHSTMVQRKVKSSKSSQNAIILSTLEDYSVPCGHNTDVVIKVSQEYKRHLGEQGQGRDGFFELVKLNYNHLSKVDSFKGIGVGLEMLNEGVDEKYISSRDRHHLKSLIRKSKILNFEYQQDLLDLQQKGEFDKLESITSFYEEERILLRTKVRKYLERLVQNYPGDRTANL